MLTSWISAKASKVTFNLCMRNGEPIASFTYPLMATSELRKMIAGQDAEDQNDDGFFIKVRSGVVLIEIEPNTDGGDLDPTKFNLPLEVCQPAFKTLLILHEANLDSNPDIPKCSPPDDSDDERLADVSEALEEGRDEVAKLIIQDGKPWFHVEGQGHFPGLDFVFPDWSEHKERFQELIDGIDCEYALGNGYDIMIENGVVCICSEDGDNDPWIRSFPHARAKRAFQEVAKFYQKEYVQVHEKVFAELVLRNGKPWFSMKGVGKAQSLEFEFPDWSNHPHRFQDLIDGNDCDYELGNGQDIIVENGFVHVGATPNDEDNDPPSWKFPHSAFREAFEAVANFFASRKSQKSIKRVNDTKLKRNK
jgi:hypothetical protein